jgi:hypothetical protein
MPSEKPFGGRTMFTSRCLLSVFLSLAALVPLCARAPETTGETGRKQSPHAGRVFPRNTPLVARFAPIPPGTRLTYKLEKGQTFYQTMSTVTTQTMKVLGSDATQKQEQTYFFSWTPVKQEADRSWIVKQKIEGVRMSIDIGGNKVEYDSTQEGGNLPLGDFFKAMVGSEFTLTLSPDLKVTRVGGRDEFVEKLVKTNPALKDLLEQILSEDALKQMADPAFCVIPKKAVHKGESWECKNTLDLGPIGIYETKNTYTYQGLGKAPNRAKIAINSDLTYKEPADARGGVLPFKVKKSDLKTVESGGFIEFDTERGRIVKSETMIALKGRLSVEIGGTISEIDLEQTQQTVVETSDSNPLTK